VGLEGQNYCSGTAALGQFLTFGVAHFSDPQGSAVVTPKQTVDKPACLRP
jgi:hypothetical protein